MEGHYAAIAACWSCARAFAFDPERVPSIPIDPSNGLPADLGGDPARCVRQPVCRECIDRANANRRASGLGPIPVLPGAYCD